MKPFEGRILKAASKKFFFLVVLVLCSQLLAAQDSSGTKKEVWPEVNVFYKINDKVRIYANYSATKLKNSSYTDGGFGVYIDYFAFPVVRKKIDPNLRDSTRGYYLWLRAGYLHSSTPPEAKDPFKENTLVTEFNFRFHLPWHIQLTNKNRFDWRTIDAAFVPRYRPRLTFEKDMRTEYMYFTPSVYVEYQVYFKGEGLDRFRVNGSIQSKVTRHLELETYYVHQFANGENVKALDAIGFVLKFYFKYKDRSSKKTKT